jgi:hypothetical protein
VLYTVKKERPNATHIISVPFNSNLLSLIYIIQHVIQQYGFLLDFLQFGFSLRCIIWSFVGFLFGEGGKEDREMFGLAMVMMEPRHERYVQLQIKLSSTLALELNL